MPQIVRAEYLKYYNPSRNSDKVFNVFLIEDEDGTFSCISEYGRRGNKLVRDPLCTNARREVAESKLRQKLLAKRNHRQTPYSDDPFGRSISSIAGEYEFREAENNIENRSRVDQFSCSVSEIPKKQNVIKFPTDKIKNKRQNPKSNGIFNQEQFDSLEI